jgi:anti-anti-sigma regulatory factor
MNAPSPKMLIYSGKESACIKIVGRATFTSSIDLKTVISELNQRGYTWFVLELSECSLMDSTFLGVLAGFGLKMAASPAPPGVPVIELLNPPPRIVDLLENLGVLQLFKVNQGNAPCIRAPEEVVAHTPGQPSREEVTRACLEAHETLMELNPANIPKFKDVAQFMAEDLKRIKEGR